MVDGTIDVIVRAKEGEDHGKIEAGVDTEKEGERLQNISKAVEKYRQEHTSTVHICNGLSMAIPIFFITGTSSFSPMILSPRFLARRYRIRLLDVSFIKTITMPTGAQMKRMIQIENFQLLLYCAMTYAPTRGPRDGPRKGARMYVNATLPALLGFHKSTTVPGRL
jgi:hypothetical protein